VAAFSPPLVKASRAVMAAWRAAATPEARPQVAETTPALPLLQAVFRARLQEDLSRPQVARDVPQLGLSSATQMQTVSPSLR
jgi:hypothetical protein